MAEKNGKSDKDLTENDMSNSPSVKRKGKLLKTAVQRGEWKEAVLLGEFYRQFAEREHPRQR